MVKTLQDKLEGLAIDVSNIYNFNYASEYGYNKKAISNLIDDIKRDFPNVYLERSDKTMLEIPLEPDTSEVNILKLKRRISEVRKIFKKLRKDKSYKELFRAYKEDNQEDIAKYLEGVFVDLSKSEIIPPESRKLELFHGVTVPKGMEPEKYLDLCVKIMENGLKPSPYGLHMGMDRLIRPIFATPEKYDTHGLAFFSFNPSEYTVVLDDRLDEARIYTPVLKTKFNLWLRDSDTLQSYNGFETGIIGKKAESYAKSLEKIAQKRGVKFKKLGLPQSL